MRVQTPYKFNEPNFNLSNVSFLFPSLTCLMELLISPKKKKSPHNQQNVNLICFQYNIFKKYVIGMFSIQLNNKNLKLSQKKFILHLKIPANE